MNVASLLTDLYGLEQQLAATYREAAQVHAPERDVHYQSLTFAEHATGTQKVCPATITGSDREGRLP